MIAEAQRLTALKREKIELVVAETARSSEAIDLDAIDHMHDNPVTDDDCEVIAFDRHRLAQRLPLRMPNLGAVILPFVPDQRGVTSIQYSILCAGIALAIVSSLGGTLGAAFQSISAYLGGGEMESKEIIRQTATEFIEAVRAGLVQYIEEHIGASIDGRFLVNTRRRYPVLPSVSFRLEEDRGMSVTPERQALHLAS
ncbi:Flp family type IVb pilin [Bradyrhizobium sp. 6(2017)]|uniref:Flp family type IVb pilin n=1 Tax=Bradyrhizobium sp. 6(2017) TaxID=1197460 RepID=UPI0013E17AC6|nr:Flp family type IVb pilin [Bradyrhizobium sp. 6(2017)]QIG91049.1 Flp family type IVb pilin [Bradyrhizobium sp. 6(2017)]